MTIQCPIVVTVTAPTPPITYAASDGSTPPETIVCILSSTGNPINAPVYAINKQGTMVAWFGTYYVVVETVSGIVWYCNPTDLKIGAC